MGFLKSSSLIRWWEPAFFGLRNRRRSGWGGWLRRAGRTILLGVAMLAFLAFNEPGRVTVANLPIFSAALALIALIVATIPDLDTRDVHVNVSGIIASGLLASFSFGEEDVLLFSQVARCEVLGPEVTGSRFSVLKLITHNGKVVEYGVPLSVSRDELATHLARVGVLVAAADGADSRG